MSGLMPLGVKHPLRNSHYLSGQINIRRVNRKQKEENHAKIEHSRLERFHYVRGCDQRVLNE